ncbi:MAG: ABC transporter permease subunit, partial [Escherichia coli]|nr:ABC transporter permease subunit [Escherichia coli]
MSRLSPVNQARWARFRHNRRGYWSLWIFLVLFGLSLCSELIANDKPLLVRYDGSWYFPLLKNYSESDFGGPLASQADYQDPWLKQRLDLYGTRISVLFGLMLTLCSSVMGVLAGALQGYYGGKVDLWGQRFIEVWSGMPTLFLIILLSSVVQPNFWWLLAITVLFGWMSLVGVVRAEFLRTRNFDYIRAAQALGVSDRSIILRHMLPNAMVATLTFLPFILCSSITTLTSLDFLGFGLPLGSPSLGELLLQGKNNLQAPWLGITAFLSVAILLSLLIFIGE